MDAAAGSKRKRARKACQLCHQRKLKCGNELPKCNNCTTYERECVYHEGPKKPRPSNDRIERLEEENRSLQAQLAQITPRSTEAASADQPFTGTSDSEPSTNGREGSTGHQPDPASLPPSSNNNLLSDLEYHGPSSALFDATFWRTSETGDKSNFNLPSERVTSQLMNEAAAQRMSSAFLTADILSDRLIPIHRPGRTCQFRREAARPRWDRTRTRRRAAIVVLENCKFLLVVGLSTSLHA